MLLSVCQTDRKWSAHCVWHLLFHLITLFCLTSDQPKQRNSSSVH
jgi:hypothetical protein